jgi:guanine deaminase
MGNDRLFLQRAIEIAITGIAKGGGPFGAVITRNGEKISESFNRVVLSHDPTAHAEINAIREAAELLKSHDLSECTLYSSCEPCPMCLGAIYWAGIKKIVYACTRYDAEGAGFSDKLIYEELSLDPSERKIYFLQMRDAGGEQIFIKWNESDNKIPY